MRIKAFRGYRHGIGRERDVTKVVAPPYDQPRDAGASLRAEPGQHRAGLLSDRRAGHGRDRWQIWAGETLDRWPCY